MLGSLDTHFSLHLLWIVYLIVVVFPFQWTNGIGTCKSIDTTSDWAYNTYDPKSWCTTILDYNNIYIPDNLCTNDMESQLRGNTRLLDLLSSECRKIFWYIACLKQFPPCNSTSSIPESIPLCTNSCINLINNPSCTLDDWNMISLFNASWIFLDCNTNYTLPNCHEAIINNVYMNRSKCVTYPGGVCQDVVKYPVFLDSHWNLDQVYQITENTLKDLFYTIAFTGPECSQAITRFACSFGYTKCVPNLISTQLNRTLTYEPVLPSTTCFSVCEDFRKSCVDVLGLLESFGYWTDCAKYNDSGSLPSRFLFMANYSCTNDRIFYDNDFPNGSYTLSYLPMKINGNTLSTPCYTLNGSAQVNCNPPTVIAPANYYGYLRSIIKDSICELPCPATYIWQENEWKNAENIMYLTFPSFFLSSFMVCTWLIFPIKRKQHFILSFIICIWFIAFVLVFSFAAVANNPDPNLRTSLRYISCKNSAEGAHMDGSPSFCVFQAIILYLFLLSATCWWFFITLDVFRRVVLEARYTKREETKNNIIYHSIAWGFPVFSLVIFLSSGGQLGGSNTSIFLFCFIYTSHNTLDPWASTSFDKWRDYLLWYAPIGLLGIVGFCLMVSSITKIFQTTRRTRSTLKRNDLIGLHLRPILFVLSFFLVFFWFFVWRVQHSLHSTQWINSVQEWVVCYGRNVKGEDCGAYPRERLATWSWYGLHVFLSLQGIILTFTWGTQLDNLILWKNFCYKENRGCCKSIGSSFQHSTGHSSDHSQVSSRPPVEGGGGGGGVPGTPSIGSAGGGGGGTGGNAIEMIEISHKKLSRGEGLGGSSGSGFGSGVGGGDDYLGSQSSPSRGSHEEPNRRLSTTGDSP